MEFHFKDLKEIEAYFRMRAKQEADDLKARMDRTSISERYRSQSRAAQAIWHQAADVIGAAKIGESNDQS